MIDILLYNKFATTYRTLLKKLRKFEVLKFFPRH